MSGSNFNRNEVNIRPEGRSRRAWAKWLGAAPLLISLLVLILLSRTSNIPVFHIPNFPGQYFNIILLGGASFLVAYLAWRRFIASGQAQVLLFGSGALSLGMAMVLGSGLFLLVGQGNIGTTLYGTEALLAGILFLTGAAVGLSGRLFKPQMHRKRLAFGVYAAMLLIPTLVWALSATGVIPVFYVPGEGVTMIRTVVLVTALSLFTIAGLADLWLNRRTHGSFLYWYGMGLLLLTLGLFAWRFVNVSDDSFSWLGRLAQYVGGIYFVIAAVSAAREARTRRVPVAEVIAAFFRQARESYQRAADVTGAAVVSYGNWSVAKWVGVVVPSLLIVLLFVSRAGAIGFVSYPPLLFSILNIIFVPIISFIIAYLAASSFMATGRSHLAWLGGGALVFGFSGLLSALFQSQLNVSIVIHNIGALLAAMLYLTGALAGLRGPSGIRQPRGQGRVLAGIYCMGVASVCIVTVLGLLNILPTFFVPGTGATFLRQVVVYSATALFGVSGILLLFTYLRIRAPFIYWYSLGLILITLGLLTVSFIQIPGDIFAWLGRGSQYIGGVYLTIATVSVIREARTKQVPVEQVIAEFGERAKVNYELLVNSASDAIIAVDGLGRMLTWNLAAERMFGYTKKEAIGLPFFNLIPAPEQATSYQKASETFTPETEATGSPVMMELIARRKNGEEFPVSLTLTSKRLMAGWLPTTTTTLIIRDVIERKKAEEALQESEEKYRSLFTNISIGYAFCKMLFDDKNHPVDFIYIEVNDAFERLTGLKRSDVVGKRVTEAIPGINEANPEVIATYGKVVLTGELATFEVFFQPLQMWLSITVYRPKDGYFVAIFDNVTERKKAEEALKKSERRLVEAQRTAHIGSWEWDLKTGEMHWSDEMFRIVGVKPRSFTPNLESAVERMHPDDRQKVQEQMDELMAKGTASYEHRVVLPDGSIRNVSTNSIVTYDESGRPKSVAGTLQDITERKKADQIKDEFIGMVSHELKTPLTVLMGSLHTLTAEGLSEKDAKELLRDAINGTDTLASIVENLLELSRSQANRLGLRTEQVDIGQIARDVVQKLRSKSAIHRLNVDLPEGLPPVLVDPVRVERIIFNLVENAVKYSPKGGEVRISAQQENGELVVSVSDQGPGISPDDQKKLFQSFEQLAINNRQAMQGVGLGLKVCRTLVEAHGGRIWVKSEPGKGSSFYFTLLMKGAAAAK